MAPWNAAMTTELNTLTQDFELILLSTEDKNNHELSKKLQDNLSNDFRWKPSRTAFTETTNTR